MPLKMSGLFYCAVVSDHCENYTGIILQWFIQNEDYTK